MNALIVAAFASLAALACAAPSGLGLGLHGGVAEAAVLTGPSGVVTNHGAIGPVGHGLGLGLGLGLGHGAVLAAPAVAAVAAPAVLAAPALAVGHGAGVITNGGGTIGVSAHGAAIRGPPTAPVVVAGPSGKIAADGLWGPTANVGLGAGGWAGHAGVLAGHGGWAGHGAWGHGW